MGNSLAITYPRESPECRAKRHGTCSAYQRWGCRCPRARTAWRRYRKNRATGRQPQGWVPAIGTHRRLQALQALGWPRGELARRLGCTGGESITGLLRRKRVHRHTVTRVARLYEKLSMTLGPCRQVATRALAKGWMPPLAWDDDTLEDPNAKPHAATSERNSPPGPVAIMQVCQGIRPSNRLNNNERSAAVSRLTTLGYSATAIADRLRISARTVTRYRTSRNVA